MTTEPTPRAPRRTSDRQKAAEALDAFNAAEAIEDPGVPRDEPESPANDTEIPPPG